MKIKAIRKYQFDGKVYNLSCVPEHAFKLSAGVYTHNCGTGDFFVRSLTAEEIVFQVQELFKDRNIDVEKVKRCQIMFMSMGEPMLNFKALSEAIVILHHLYPRFALLISTSGPAVDYGPLRLLSVSVPTVGLQFSVHESTDDARNKLIPFKAKLTLQEIAKEGEEWFYATGRQPFFNYCAHPDNISADDAHRLRMLFDPHIWQATISVICERDEHVAAANARQRQLALDFMDRLNAYGYSTRCFDPAGQDDIGGGCGMLWFVQDWAKQHPKLVRPSIGCGLPEVHTPRLVELTD